MPIDHAVVTSSDILRIPGDIGNHPLPPTILQIFFSLFFLLLHAHSIDHLNKTIFSLLICSTRLNYSCISNSSCGRIFSNFHFFSLHSPPFRLSCSCYSNSSYERNRFQFPFFLFLSLPPSVFPLCLFIQRCQFAISLTILPPLVGKKSDARRARKRIQRAYDRQQYLVPDWYGYRRPAEEGNLTPVHYQPRDRTPSARGTGRGSSRGSEVPRSTRPVSWREQQEAYRLWLRTLPEPPHFAAQRIARETGLGLSIDEHGNQTISIHPWLTYDPASHRAAIALSQPLPQEPDRQEEDEESFDGIELL